jgi:tRNA-modifying protein YgfZ
MKTVGNRALGTGVMTLDSLRAIQAQMGASFDSQSGFPLSFDYGSRPSQGGEATLLAASTGVAIVDRSHWGILKFTGADRLRYLHNQSTNNFQILEGGQGCDTVFVTSTARTIDLATAYVTADEILTIISPNRRHYLYEWLDRFIFPMDQVAITDVSEQYAVFSLVGTQSSSLLQKIGLESMPKLPQHYNQNCQIDDLTVLVAVGSGLGLDGYTFLVPVTGAAKIWQKLTDLGAVPLGDRVWEQLRILQGRPAPDRELTEDYNPLEAGLWYAISFNKGCYIGQETIARLNTYQGVKQRLWGIELASFVPEKTDIFLGDSKVGTLTSSIVTPAGVRGLAYLKTKAGGAGSMVAVGETTGKIIVVPFLTHEYYR